MTLALGLSGSPSLAQSTNATPADGPRGKAALEVRGKFIDQRIAEFMEKHDVPGLAMAIVQAPYIPRSAGYGRASLTHDELASTRTTWNIGPLTQGFTAVAIFQLHETQKLDIHDAIDKHLTGLPAAWAKTTVLELLQHASGIPDYRAAPGFDSSRAYKPAELLAAVSAAPVLFERGSQVRLSATNFLLLGMIVERTSGMSFHDYVTRHQIEPLGLRSTMFVGDFPTKSFTDRSPKAAGKKQHSRFTSEIAFINPVEPATGHKTVDGKLVATDPKTSANLFAFGDLWSSAEDISAWDIALAGGILVKSEANRALIYKPTKLGNGTIVPAMAGWEFTHHPGFMEIKGSAPGFSAYLSRFTAVDDLVCVTLLVNKEGLDLTVLARDIADSYKAGLGAGVASEGIVAQESKFPVDETVSRLEARLKAQNVPVFATFDHSANAQQAGMQLRPTKVLVFGNPKVGTKLMQDNQAVALDLPLRLSVWEDGRGRVWVGYHALDRLAAEYGIKDEATVTAMAQALEKLVAKAVNVYDY
ncbi:serine hydrolase [Reyranella sp.]|uniref:serine hydrolase n=1 Tax=Reyranella sp. TaxID=1929291 RepID=UPI0025FC07DF|nr:serine hydrolase [Reyranella sp.]